MSIAPTTSNNTVLEQKSGEEFMFNSVRMSTSRVEKKRNNIVTAELASTKMQAEIVRLQMQAEMDAQKAEIVRLQMQAEMDAQKAEIVRLNMTAELDSAKMPVELVLTEGEHCKRNNTKSTPANGSPKWEKNKGGEIKDNQVDLNNFPELPASKLETTYMRPINVSKEHEELKALKEPKEPQVRQSCFKCYTQNPLRNNRCKGCTEDCTYGKRCSRNECGFGHPGDKYDEKFVPKCENCTNSTFDGHRLCNSCFKRNKNVERLNCAKCGDRTFMTNLLCTPCYKTQKN
jgi:hypothetical protein